VSLRPARPEDRAFLFRLYAETRAAEMALVPWSEGQRLAFLTMQFEAQDRSYHGNFPSARFDVLELGGAPAGRLYVDRGQDEIRVIDITLLPEKRGQGVGSALFHDLFAEAAASGRLVTIHVDSRNPAGRLYERLGFVEVRDEGVYRFMQWSPPLRGEGPNGPERMSI
jgi:ribosomal protein S18 acetylase RimI-like enzyme